MGITVNFNNKFILIINKIYNVTANRLVSAELFTVDFLGFQFLPEFFFCFGGFMS